MPPLKKLRIKSVTNYGQHGSGDVAHHKKCFPLLHRAKMMKGLWVMDRVWCWIWDGPAGVSGRLPQFSGHLEDYVEMWKTYQTFHKTKRNNILYNAG